MNDELHFDFLAKHQDAIGTSLSTVDHAAKISCIRTLTGTVDINICSTSRTCSRLKSRTSSSMSSATLLTFSVMRSHKSIEQRF